MNKKNQAFELVSKYFVVILYSISTLFYLFFFFYDGTIICHDSPNYIDMNFSREPFYPLLLALCRFLFRGQSDFYLTIVVLIQSLLAAVAAASLVSYLYKELKLGKCFTLLLLAFPLFTSYLCRFAAKRSAMYSNSILTEGIAISLYLLFFRYLLEYCFHKTKKGFIGCFVLSVILLSTRKQMAIVAALFCIGILAVTWGKSKGKALLHSFVTGLAILLIVSLFDRGYNYCLRGEFVGHSNDNRFVSTMIFYTAERSDASYIDNPDLQELFLQIYDTCDEKGYLMHSAGDGWNNENNHFGESYDMIQLYELVPSLTEYVGTHYDLVQTDIERTIDEINNVFIASLLPHELAKIGKVLINNFLSGLVTTVAKNNTILIYYTVAAYLLYALMLAVLIMKKKKSPNGDFLQKTIVLSVFSLLGIILNLLLVSAVIFCQSRYTIYNMPLFYISFVVMGREMIPFIYLHKNT